MTTNHLNQRLIHCVSAAVLLFAVGAQAASFDCNKAASATEKLICSNPTVSQLDEQLGQAYKQALTNANNKDALKQQQMEWLKQQRACKDVDCLTQTYQARIAQLQKSEALVATQATAPQPTAPTPTEKTIHFTLVRGNSYPLCQPYVDMLNATHYTQMPVCERKILPEFKQFKNFEWIEMTDKNEMIKSVSERVKIEAAMDSVEAEVPRRIKSYIEDINNNKVKLFYIDIDFNNDGKIDRIFKTLSQPRMAASKDYCETITVNYFADKNITVENAKSHVNPPFTLLSGLRSGQLFLMRSEIYNSFWEGEYLNQGANLTLYAYGKNDEICAILAK